MILITGYADKENAIKAINEVGIYHYVEKPWDNNELLIIIKNAVERGNLIKELNLKYLDIRKSYISTIFRLAQASEMFDDDTYNHVLRLGLLSQKLAELLNYPHDFCENIKYAAMMHDVGKIGIPKDILNKKGKLTEDEFLIVKRHVEFGAKVLENPDNTIIEMAYHIAKYHHEKWNGKGYQNNLKADKIPPEARIVAITDVFDALLSPRPYKEPFPCEKVKNILQDEKGVHFDPEMCQTFLDHFDDFVQIYHQTARLQGEILSDHLFHRKKLF